MLNIMPFGELPEDQSWQKTVPKTAMISKHVQHTRGQRDVHRSESDKKQIEGDIVYNGVPPEQRLKLGVEWSGPHRVH